MKKVKNPRQPEIIDKTNLQTLQNMIDALSRRQMGVPLSEIEVTFEFLIGSLYPDIYFRVMDQISSQYTQGYVDGQKEVKNGHNTGNK